jgi:hypothetical protein
MVTGGRPITGNLAGVATRASRGGEIWGERELTGGPQLSATADCNRLAGWLTCGAGPAAEKMAHDDFFHFKFFSN